MKLIIATGNKHKLEWPNQPQGKHVGAAEVRS